MANNMINRLVTAIELAIGRKSAALHEPLFTGNELHYLQACIESSYVSSVGVYVERFEQELAVYMGARRAVALVNGSAALQVQDRAGLSQPAFQKRLLVAQLLADQFQR